MKNLTNESFSNLKAEELQVYLSQFVQADIKTVSRFAPGVYIREMHADAGNWIVGKTHKTEHFNQILKGSCLVNIKGVESYHIAPDTFVSYEGDKKIIFALEDLIWATIHPTDETDEDKLEALIIDQEAENLIGLNMEELWLGMQ